MLIIPFLAAVYQRLSEYAGADLLEAMSNFIFEMDAPIEETISRFQATFEKKKDIISWQELNHLYIRHGMMDQAETMYTGITFITNTITIDQKEIRS